MSKIYPGEKGFKVKVTVTDETGAAVDLTGATVEFKFFHPDGSTSTKSATLDTPTSGVCSYTTTSTNDFLDPGEYGVQPKITLASGNVFYGTTQSMNVASLGT